MIEILVWLGGKLFLLEERLEMVGDELDELEMLDCRGNWGINGLGEWIVVDIIGEVVVNEGVFTIFEDSVESSEVEIVRAANSTKCWRYASSILLINVEVKASSLSKVSNTSLSKFGCIGTFFNSMNWIKLGSNTVSWIAFFDLVLNNESSNGKSN